MPNNNELDNQTTEDEKRRVIASFMSHFGSDDDEDDDVEELETDTGEELISNDPTAPTTIIVEDENQSFDDIFSDF
jgi:hypothetical protein